MERKRAQRGIVVGASSDIGLAIATDWIARGISVTGSYRTESPELARLRPQFELLARCDFADPESIRAFAAAAARGGAAWDHLVVCPGTMEPVGRFEDVDIDGWCDGFSLNLLATMRVVHALLPSRSRAPHPLVLLFAGGGTNGAPVSFSAYTAAKIALIKAVELLDAEMPDVRFTIMGPGWVRTKIHEETLRAAQAVPQAAAETSRRLAADDFNPVSRVVDCVAWAMEAPRELIGGRNFSVVHDEWGTAGLERRLRADAEMFKLRRAGNQER